MNNGQPPHIDLGKEACIAGVIAEGELFNRIPERHLIPVGAFVDARWKIIYRVARALRSSGVPVCAESVSDYIIAQGLDVELQRAVDSTKTFYWREWPNHTDKSQADPFSGTSGAEYSLKKLREYYVKREAVEIIERLRTGTISRTEAIEQLQAIGPESNDEGELFVNLAKIIEGGLQPERPTVAKARGRCLLYAGRLNEIHGEPAVGKTNVALSLARCVIEDGGSVIFIDPEDTAAGVLSRLASMGADVRALATHFHYLHNPTPAEFARAIMFAEKHKPTHGPYASAKSFVDSESGIVMGYRRHMSPGRGKMYASFEALFGFAVGLSLGLGILTRTD